MRSTGYAMLIFALVVMCSMVTLADEVIKVEQTPPVEIHIKHTEPRTVAIMRHKGPYTEIGSVTKELIGQIEKGNHLMAGPVMVRYFNDPKSVPEKDLLWEVMIPVVRPGRLGGTEFDKMVFRYMDVMNVAYLFHVGTFETISGSYAKLFEWVGRSGYEITGPPMEIYWSDPDKTPPERRVVELWVPISEERKPRVVR